MITPTRQMAEVNMNKKSKARQREPGSEEADRDTPRGASFDTEEGRAAQGMRRDIGNPQDNQGASESTEAESAMGAGDASSGGGAAAGIPGGGTDMRTQRRFSKGNVEEDRKKILPEKKKR